MQRAHNLAGTVPSSVILKSPAALPWKTLRRLSRSDDGGRTSRAAGALSGGVSLYAANRRD